MDNMQLSTVEMHSGGQALRIITSGWPSVNGKTILEKERFVKENQDHLRRMILHEPRGHLSLVAALQVEPDSNGADAAFLFMTTEGYYSMSGLAIISLGRYCIDQKLAEYKEPEALVNIQCPCGLVKAYVQCRNGQTGSVRFQNVPAFAVSSDVNVTTLTYGELKVDIAYGGAFYCFIPLREVGLDTNSSVREIGKVGTELRKILIEQLPDYFKHPVQEDLSYLSGIVFTDDDQQNNSRHFNLTVVGDAEVGRSPCGSGTTARMALLFAKELISPNEVVEFENPFTKTVFEAQVIETLQYVGEHSAVIVEVEGNGYYTGTSTFTVEENDPLKNGFFIS